VHDRTPTESSGIPDEKCDRTLLSLSRAGEGRMVGGRRIKTFCSTSSRRIAWGKEDQCSRWHEGGLRWDFCQAQKRGGYHSTAAKTPGNRRNTSLRPQGWRVSMGLPGLEDARRVSTRNTRLASRRHLRGGGVLEVEATYEKVKAKSSGSDRISKSFESGGRGPPRDPEKMLSIS